MNAIGGGVAAGSSVANLRICGPVKRSNAREPVREASAAAPPTALVIDAHWTEVLASIQIGATERDRRGASCGASGSDGSNRASALAGAAR